MTIPGDQPRRLGRFQTSENDRMWRSLFMAFGIMAIIVGAESMMIDQAVVYAAAESSAAEFIDPGMQPAQTTKVWSPGERFPWAMLAIGAVIVLYAITLPKRWHRQEG